MGAAIVGDPELPSSSLLALAHAVLTEATRIRDLKRYPRLARNLAMLSIAVERMADSGPRSHRQAARDFADHPEHAQAGQDPLSDIRAELDVISFLTVGDMVLDDVATALLERSKRPRGDVPWAHLMREVDASVVAGSLIRPARRLDLLLREARHRLVAHRRHNHHMALSWQMDGNLQVTVMRGELPPAKAVRMLQTVNSRLAIPAKTTDFIDLRDWIFGWAVDLGEQDRKWVKRALQLAGYELFGPATIVEELLQLTASVTVTAKQ